MKARIRDIIRQLNDFDHGDLWLDENYSKKLAQVNENEAFTRPLPDLHSPAEILSHLIIWRRINIRRMAGETITMEVDDPVNWKTNAMLAPMGWDGLKADFRKSREEVIAWLDEKDDDYLSTITTYEGKDVLYLMQGLIHHDAYHLGQLGIIIKYLKR